VTVPLAAAGIRAVVLDVEGTTTPVAFVYDVLFPFARAHAPACLAREPYSVSVVEAVALLTAERAGDVARGESPPESIGAYVVWLMDRDRKSRGLKALQGLIWQDGYRKGVLRGQVYADVPPALRRWQKSGLPIYIYSSGSVLAQQQLFQTTDAGDLTTLLSGHFDTAIGAKTEPESYRAIASSVDVAPDRALFVSDVTGELDAARDAGFQTALCVRGAVPPAGRYPHPVIRTFDDIID
jgi:enolase-phosphatase E1